VFKGAIQPVFVGGLFIGLLSALPFVSIANCCCLWVTSGGAVTAYLLQGGRADALSLGEGAVGGFQAGIVGAVIYAIVSVPIQLVTMPFQRELIDNALESGTDIPPLVRELLDNIGPGVELGSVMVGFGVMLVLGAVFASIGGLLGALVFRRSSSDHLPPSPLQP